MRSAFKGCVFEREIERDSEPKISVIRENNSKPVWDLNLWLICRIPVPDTHTPYLLPLKQTVKWMNSDYVVYQGDVECPLPLLTHSFFCAKIVNHLCPTVCHRHQISSPWPKQNSNQSLLRFTFTYILLRQQWYIQHVVRSPQVFQRSFRYVATMYLCERKKVILSDTPSSLMNRLND